MGRRALGLGLVAAVVAIGAAPAHAATVIGSNLLASPPDAALTTGTIVTTALPAADAATGGVAAPNSGVITSWTVRLGTGNPGNTFMLRIVDGNTAVSTGRTYPVPTAAGLHSFPERLPIKAGQLAGLRAVANSGVIGLLRNNVVGASSDSWGVTPFPDGATSTPDGNDDPVELLMQAVVEPDADIDGFGDETQDGCLGEAGPRAGCPLPPSPLVAPDTQIDSGPTSRVKKRKTTFTFSSTAAGATFECALESGGFTDCASPKKVKKLTNGTHLFRVRAISADGMIDRSPAAQSFKVKLPRR